MALAAASARPGAELGEQRRPTSNRSPTTNRSANSAMGASGSRLTATIVPAVCMPTLCWMAPLMPSARYSSGLTILPVWPICWLYGIQPESTAARVAPTAPPSCLGELLDDPEAVRPADAATAGDDDPGLLDRGGGAGLADPLDDADRGQRRGARRRRRALDRARRVAAGAAVVDVRADGDDARGRR